MTQKIKSYLNDPFSEMVFSTERYNSLDKEQQERVYKELRNVLLHEIQDRLLQLKESGFKGSNKVNSLLNWTIGITDVYPTEEIKIASPGSYLDIDIDISKQRRNEVIKYLKGKYGIDKVSQVATFSKLGAKAAVRSATRALGYKVADGDLIAKMISNEPNVTIADSIEANPELKMLANDSNQVYKHIIDTAQGLEGLPNALSTHASAVVLTDESCHKYFPLMISKKEGEDILSQWDYYDVEYNYCLKWDLLSLKTLDLLHVSCNLIKQRHKIDINLDEIDVNDPCIYELLNNGHNTLIFQFEADLFKKMVNLIHPTNIDHLSAITSIARPGCLANGIDQQYIRAKQYGEKYTYDLQDQRLIEAIWNICKDTYGLLIYQEQLIKCATDLAGYTELEGDNFRRGVSKKISDVLLKEKEKFVNACVSKNGFDREDSNKLFEKLLLFSLYSFNSAHAVAYSHITCHTAYISSKYPIEFYTAALTIDAGNTDDVRRYIAGAKKRGINILPPCINKSSVNFDIINNDILFGLTAIKGVGNSVSNKIIKNRPKKSGYTSFGHFVMRNIDILNKRILESYAKAGVFNCFGLSKNSYLDSIDRLLEFISYMKELGNRNTTFDILGLKISDYIDSIIITSSSRPDSLFYEIESLGLYITGHPFDGYLINTDVVTPIKSILDDMDVTWVDGDIGSMKTVVGVIAGIDVRKTKAKVNMATFNLSDNDNLMQCTMFPKAYSEYGYLAKEGLTVVLDGHLKKDTVGPIFIIKKAYSIGSKRGALMKILCEEKVTDNRKRRTIRVNSRLSFILTEE